MVPGPPSAMAVATHGMFPVPTVADNAVISALKGLTSPSPMTPPLSNSNRKPYPTLRQDMKTNPGVNRAPVTPRIPGMGGPQANALTESITAFS